MKKPLLFAREIVAGVLGPGAYAVDATCGNGHDTVFLAGLVGGSGRVLAMDIQEEAVAKTAARLAEAGLAARVKLVRDDHAKLGDYLDGVPDAAMFNLGYLPGGDHSLVTQPHTTVAALAAVLQALRPGGVVTIMVYTGHPGGMDEYRCVRKYLVGLPQGAFSVLEYSLINQRGNPPLLLAVSRL